MGLEIVLKPPVAGGECAALPKHADRGLAGQTRDLERPLGRPIFHADGEQVSAAARLLQGHGDPG